jgi:hypothetical protein
MAVYDIIVCMVLGIPLLALFTVEILGAFARNHHAGCGMEKTIPVEISPCDGGACKLHPCGLGLGVIPGLGCNLTD